MTYVVINPNSNTNPGPKYLVVKTGAWAAQADGKSAQLPQDHELNTYAEAEALRDSLNRESQDSGQHSPA